MNYHVAVITGASSGIGKAIAESLGQQGVKLILIARREERLQKLQEQLSSVTDCHIIACDIRDKIAIKAALEHVPKAFSHVDILVNCAGLALGLAPAHQTDWQDWETMIEVNCLALTYLCRLLLPAMVTNNHGHIINIGSTAGTYPYKGSNVYGASKAFVEQFSINLKADLLGTAVRISNIEPGMVEDCEFSLVRMHGDAEKADAIYAGINALKPADIAESVSWVLKQPPHVNINRIEVMPTGQAPSRLDYDRH